MRIVIVHLSLALVVSLLLWLTHNPQTSSLYLDLISWYSFQIGAFVFAAVAEFVYQVQHFFFPPRQSVGLVA